MKTRKVEIKIKPEEWSRHYEHNIITLDLTSEVYDQFDLAKTDTPLKITFELPVPEPEVKVTPGRIDEILYEWVMPENDKDKRSFVQYLKTKLFGEGWDK